MWLFGVGIDVIGGFVCWVWILVCGLVWVYAWLLVLLFWLGWLFSLSFIYLVVITRLLGLVGGFGLVIVDLGC